MKVCSFFTGQECVCVCGGGGGEGGVLFGGIWRVSPVEYEDPLFSRIFLGKPTPLPLVSQDQINRPQVNFSLQKCYDFFSLNRYYLMNGKLKINSKISETQNQGCKQKSKKN